MKWLQKSKYHAERSNDKTTTICWNEQQTEYWMWIKGEQIPGTFPDKEGAKRYFDKIEKER